MPLRGQDGVLRAFANVCRHRGSILLAGAGGTGGRIVCPCHARSHLTDGRLRGCPDMRDAEVENGLRALATEDRAGFVSVRFAAAGPSLAEHPGDLPERLASHGPERMRRFRTLTLDVAADRKLIPETAMETDRTGAVHRAGVGAQQSRTLPTRGDRICIRVISDASNATLSKEVPPRAGRACRPEPSAL